jgi:hypothetical protein
MLKMMKKMKGKVAGGKTISGKKRRKRPKGLMR